MLLLGVRFAPREETTPFEPRELHRVVDLSASGATRVGSLLDEPLTREEWMSLDTDPMRGAALLERKMALGLAVERSPDTTPSPQALQMSLFNG